MSVSELQHGGHEVVGLRYAQSNLRGLEVKEVVGCREAQSNLRGLTVAHQQLTIEWWQQIQPQVNCFVSPFVIEEVSNGNPEAANRRLQVVSHLPMLQANEEVKKLADTYFVAISLPERARLDASHLAMAVWHQLDYLLSWNCKHIVSARVRKIVQELNQQRELSTPIICTPTELMEI